MSLIDGFLESENPSPVGKIEFNSPEPDDDEPPEKDLIWLAITIGLILVGIGLYWTFYNLSYGNSWQVSVKLCGLVLYVMISYSLRVKPDYSNVGWLGGLMDNPFRISDNFNRWLVYLQALLVPGKLIVYSLLMSWVVCQHGWKRFRK